MFKTDIVYTWVDDKDASWLEKKSKYDSSSSKLNKDATDECRFFNNDELKYSLRSIEKYAPWINKIFIVVDNQKPSWLNLDNEKIRLVDHREIIPSNKLPLFNSCAIENSICDIKDLSEYFIYANDDMLFWDSVDFEFFFKDGKPVYYLDKKINKFKNYKHIYGYTIYRAYKLAKESLCVDVPYFPYHNIDPYRKSLFLECKEKFKNEFNQTLNNRFRDFSDMQRMIISYYSFFKGEAIFKNTGLNFIDKYIKRKSKVAQYYTISSKTTEKIKNSKAKLMCINDSRKTTNKDREKIKEILENKFPQKSCFEV